MCFMCFQDIKHIFFLDENKLQMSKMSELHGFLFQECGTTYNTLYFLVTGIHSLNDVHLQVHI